MAQRCIALYLFFSTWGLQRSRAKGPVQGPWKNELLSTIIGQVNREAAEQYKERVGETVRNEYGPFSRLAYMAKRWVFATAWAALCYIISIISGKQHED